MGNLFFNLPLAAGQGPGPAVDVSGMGKSKTLVAGDVLGGHGAQTAYEDLK